MPSPNPPQAQGAQVCLPCGLKRAIPGYEAAMAGHVSGRDRISKSLDRPVSAVSRAVSFMFRGVGEPTWSLANGLNANLVRRWVKEHREGVRSDGVGAGEGGLGPAERTAAPAQFVAVAVAAESAALAGEIRLEVRRGDTVVHITWPGAQAGV